MISPRTLFDKIWDAHVVTRVEKGPDVLYIDKHLIHEVTSPQAFEGIRNRNLKIFRPLRTLATTDHNVPTTDQHLPIQDEMSRIQVAMLEENCRDSGIECYSMGHPHQGIVHVIAPELGVSLPGMTIVCGDSHTSTHGAFGAIAFGIGTSEVEQVFASQCLLQERPQTMKIAIEGRLTAGVTAKDLVLALIAEIGTDGAAGYFVEYSGTAIKNLSMEGRMTLCNMSIEMGARGGLIAPDEKTFNYLKGRPFTPGGNNWEKAIAYWETLVSDPGAKFDRYVDFNANGLTPRITYGTNPAMGTGVTETIPLQKSESDLNALRYMRWKEGELIAAKKIGYVFIGSCTNSRIEDLRDAAALLRGKRKAAHVKAFVVPGSRKVREQAILEGLDRIFMDAGFEFREPGCSACLGMNEDKIPAGEFCVSTSNRNFQGRQGPGACTILASPLTAAASAIKGYVADPREFSQK